MKLTEFLIAFKEQDKEKVGSVKIRRYITLDEKLKIISRLQPMFLEMQTKGGFDSTEFQKEKELIRFFDILLAYTDIDVDERTVDMFDDCMLLDIDKFFYHYCYRDCDRFYSIVNEQIQVSDAYLLRDAIMSVNSGKLEKEFKNVIKDLKNNADVFANLNEILGIDHGKNAH